MLKFRKKKKTVLPSFDVLQKSAIKDKYFQRAAQYDVLEGEQIYVVDSQAPRMITMDPWPQTVYLEASGQRTVEEFVRWLAGQYDTPAPSDLDRTVIEVIETLVKNRIIKLFDTAQTLPYYFDKPISTQDKEKAERLMREDGFIE